MEQGCRKEWGKRGGKKGESGRTGRTEGMTGLWRWKEEDPGGVDGQKNGGGGISIAARIDEMSFRQTEYVN